MKLSKLVMVLLCLSAAITHAEIQVETQEELLAQYDKEAEIVSEQVLKELGSALKKQMKEAGPESAVKVCSELAPQIVNRISIEKGWRVTRVGTRARNPLLGSADAWEQNAFAYFEALKAEGKLLKTPQYSAITNEPSGRYYRYMKPLDMQPVCTVCHGSSDNVPAIIKQKYPHDLATGYTKGELRGGVSIKIPIHD